MKIVLIRFTQRRGATRTVPWHFSFFKDILEKEGHSVDIIDNQVEDYSINELIDVILRNNYELVGTGGIGTVYGYLRVFSTLLKTKKPEVIIVVGGQIVADYGFIMQTCPIDISVLGEGEITLSKIVSSLIRRTGYEAIPGVVFRRDGRIIKTNPEEPIDMDALPDYNFNNLKIEKYNTEVTGEFLVDKRAKRLKEEGHRYLSIFLARGCPYSCFFCYRQIEGYRTYNKDKLEQTLRHLKSNRYSFFTFNDECLTTDKQYLKLICELTKKYEIYWNTSGRADHINADILKMLKDSNCVGIMYGIESFDDNMLKAMWKKITSRQNIDALNLSYQYGLNPAGVQFILGAPGEDRRSIFNTRKGLWSSYIYEDSIAAGVLNPYPGSPAYYYGIANGYIRDKENIHRELASKTKIVVNFSKLSNAELLTWQKWLGCEAAISFRIKHSTLKMNKSLIYRLNNFLKAYARLLFKEPISFAMFNIYLILGFSYWIKPVKKLRWSELVYN